MVFSLQLVKSTSSTTAAGTQWGGSWALGPLAASPAGRSPVFGETFYTY